MQEFLGWLKEGFHHITDLQGYDHMLFITALVAAYLPSQWKKLIVLVTSFTIGHSISLAMAVLGYVTVQRGVVEFLIPLTIFISGGMNVIAPDRRLLDSRIFFEWKYVTALFFGLIHGLGFSNYLRDLLGSEESILMPLFGFNVGLELGQILVVSLFMGLAALAMKSRYFKQQYWTLIWSVFAMGWAVLMMIERAGELMYT